MIARIYPETGPGAKGAYHLGRDEYAIDYRGFVTLMR